MATNVSAAGGNHLGRFTFTFLDTGTVGLLETCMYYILSQGEVENVSEDTCQLVRACSEYPSW